MCIGVGDTTKDRMLVEQRLEPADIHAHREDQQQERKRNREPAPGQWDGAASAASEDVGAAGNENKENGDYTGNHGQRQQPARDELPGRKGE